MPIDPKNLNPEDYVAYLIGRIMIEWGELDQRLYSDIGRLDLAKRRTTPTYTQDIEIDKRFEHRRKQWRRLCLELSKSAAAIMSDVDRAVTELKRLEEPRSHYGARPSDLAAKRFSQFPNPTPGCRRALGVNEGSYGRKLVTA